MAQDLVTTDTREVESILDKDLEDFVTFTVGGQLFGIPILKVQDILNLEEIAPIPLSPPKVKGAINLRGRIVTVVSVRVCPLCSFKRTSTLKRHKRQPHRDQTVPRLSRLIRFYVVLFGKWLATAPEQVIEV